MYILLNNCLRTRAAKSRRATNFSHTKTVTHEVDNWYLACTEGGHASKNVTWRQMCCRTEASSECDCAGSRRIAQENLGVRANGGAIRGINHHVSSGTDEVEELARRNVDRWRSGEANCRYSRTRCGKPCVRIHLLSRDNITIRKNRIALIH